MGAAGPSHRDGRVRTASLPGIAAVAHVRLCIYRPCGFFFVFKTILFIIITKYVCVCVCAWTIILYIYYYYYYVRNERSSN